MSRRETIARRAMTWGSAVGVGVIASGKASGVVYDWLLSNDASLRERALKALDEGASIDRLFRTLDFFLPNASHVSVGQRVNYSELEVRNAHFKTTTRFHKATFAGSLIENTVFRDCSLVGVDFTDAVLRDVVFEGCVFEAAYMRVAEAESVTFLDCRFSDGYSAPWDFFWELRWSGRFSNVVFTDCAIYGADFRNVTFENASFKDCQFKDANFTNLDMRGATFIDCDLSWANFIEADLRATTFHACDLNFAFMNNARIDQSKFSENKIYGLSLWGTTGSTELALANRVGIDSERASVRVDGLHIALLIQSLLEGNGVRELVDGMSSIVLLLGRFDPTTLPLLHKIQDALRQRGYAPIVFDTGESLSRDMTETVGILGRLARFVIADVTAPRSSPHELAQFIPFVKTPVQVVSRGESAFAMFDDMKKYPWVLPPAVFGSDESLIAALDDMLQRLEAKRTQVG